MLPPAPTIFRHGQGVPKNLERAFGRVCIGEPNALRQCESARGYGAPPATVLPARAQ